MSPGRAEAHAEDARSALTRRPARSYLRPDIAPSHRACAVDSRESTSVPSHLSSAAPLLSAEPTGLKPTHTCFRRAGKRAAVPRQCCGEVAASASAVAALDPDYRARFGPVRSGAPGWPGPGYLHGTHGHPNPRASKQLLPRSTLTKKPARLVDQSPSVPSPKKAAEVPGPGTGGCT